MTPEARVPAAEKTCDDLISDALQAGLDDEEGTGHIVLDWILVAQVLDPSGKTGTNIRLRDEEVSYVTAYGLLEYARNEIVAQQVGGDE